MLVSRERNRLVSRVGEDEGYGCYYRVEQDLDVHRASVRYWWLKSQDPTFHANSCGGKRHGVFEDWEKIAVKQYVVEFLTAFPHSNLAEIANEISHCFTRTVTPRVFILFVFSFFSLILFVLFLFLFLFN